MKPIKLKKNCLSWFYNKTFILNNGYDGLSLGY